MKKLISPGVTLTLSFRSVPAALRAGSGRAFAMGSLDWSPDGTERQSAVIGWILANGDVCEYRYASVTNADQGPMNAALTRLDDNAWGGLSGGRLFNYVIRQTCIEKIVL